MTETVRRSRATSKRSTEGQATGTDLTPVAPPALAWRHPAWIVAAVATTVSVMISISFQIYEKDFWQHLAVGRAIWELGRVPTTQLWTWPTFGAPDVNSSWGFRALLWPIWEGAGVWGLFAWRWATTAIVFALSLLTARRLGAAGVTPLVVIALCALTYRQRSQVRPETLAAIWLALSMWILEMRRNAPGRPSRFWRDPAIAMPPVLWAWANTHLSFPVGFGLLAIHALEAHRTAARARPGPGALWAAAVAGAALVLVNPFGFAAVLQPFAFFMGQRSEPIYRTIPELWPLELSQNLRNLLPLVLFGWPALIVWRATRRRFDPVETALAVGFLSLAFLSQRFLGFTMVVAAPYLARDLDAWVGSRRWPAWTEPAWTRAGLAAAASLLLGIPEWSRRDLPLGVSIRWTEYPVAACDFMAREGVSGRGFNPFFLGGYLLHRFWPDRGRLPFMDIHQTGVREDRDAYALAMTEPLGWRVLDDRHRFDYVLLKRMAYAGDRMLEIVDADTAFALVFLDDAAALWVRRDGPLASVAERHAYRELPAGTSRLGALGFAATRDSSRRLRIVAELEREVAGSPHHAQALGRMGSLALAIGDLATARRRLEEALRVDPRAPRAHERLGIIALAEGRPRAALEAFDAEHRVQGARFAHEHYQRGRAWQALGDRDAATRHYRRELSIDPGHQPARDSLAALGAL